MTCDEFSMESHTHLYHRNEIEWDIKARDGSVRIEFSVYNDVVQEVVKDNFENFSDTLKDELTDRVVNAWDLGEITDAEKAVFLTILGKVMG